MPFSIKEHEPDYVFIHYDISKPSVRASMLHALRKARFVMRSESVYYGKYSKSLMDDAKMIEKEHTQFINLEIVAPLYSHSDFEMLRKRYEQSFVAQFDDLIQNLRRTEKILADEVLFIDRKKSIKRPYTADQIESRLKTQEYIMRELETALVKRIQDEKDFDPEALQEKLKWIRAFMDKLVDANERRRKREAGRAYKEEKLTDADLAEMKKADKDTAKEVA